MSTICHVPPVSPDEETALIVRAQDGDQDATMALVSQHIRRVTSIARRWRWAAPEDDLVLAGLEGLLRAIKAHAADGRRLWSLGHSGCLESVRAAALSEVGLLDVPHTTASRVEAYVAATKAGEVAEAPGDVSTETLHAALMAMMGTVSYSADPAALDAASVADIASTHAVVQDLVRRAMDAQTSDRDRMVLRLAYGFEGFPMTDREVAHAMGISSRTMAERIRRVALGRARAALNVDEVAA